MANKEQSSNESAVLNKVTLGARTEVSIPATAGGTVVIAANASRKGGYIQNSSEGAGKDCWIAFGADPIAQKGFPLLKGEVLILDAELLTTQEVKAITSTGSTTLTYQEGT